MRTFLHVGCGTKRKDQTTAGFNTDAWYERRLDINVKADPDIVGTMTDLSAIRDGSFDAVFSAHNIEHLYPHEVPQALASFKRILKPDGFVVLTCPNLQSVCAAVAEDRLEDPLYTAPAGPIAPLDILYGYRVDLAQGNLFMAHRCGFTERTLIAALTGGGFAHVATFKRAHPYHDIWAVASVSPMTEADIRELALQHFPIRLG